MNVNFNILNQKGAPAVYEDALANIPAPSYPGRLFVDTDQPTSTGIYRDTGTSWQQIAGGGGGGVNIYNSDGTLTDPTRTLNGANNTLKFDQLNGFNVENSFSVSFYKINSFSVETNNKQGFLIEDATQTMGFYDALLPYPFWIGLELNKFSKVYKFGQINGGNTTNFTINDATQQIYTKNGANFWGLYFDFLNNDYRIGRLTGNGSQMFLTPLVATINLGNGTTTQAQMGLTASQCNFGFIPALGGELRFIGSNFSITGITSYTINGTGITQGTSGSVSGQHLKVTINGVNYVIELKNP